MGMLARNTKLIIMAEISFKNNWKKKLSYFLIQSPFGVSVMVNLVQQDYLPWDLCKWLDVKFIGLNVISEITYVLWSLVQLDHQLHYLEERSWAT